MKQFINYPISLIIPTYNRRERLIMTLQSVTNNRILPNEIIIVDQTKDQKQVELLKNALTEIKYKNITTNIIYYHLETQSITYARNFGVNKASNDLILFTDDDINFVDNNAIDVFYNRISNNDVALVCAPDILTMHQKRVRTLMSYICGYKSFTKRSKGSISKSIYGSYPTNISNDVETEWAMGYFFGIKKHLMVKWGVWFDEKMTRYAYGEDLDFSARYCECARRNNLKSLLCPEIRVEHCVDKSGREDNQTSCSKIFINRMYMYYKFFKLKGFKLYDYWWSNNCTIIRYIGKKEFSFYRNAKKLCKKHKQELSKGILKESFYYE